MSTGPLPAGTGAMPPADEQALEPWLHWSGLGALLSGAQLAQLPLPPFNVATAADLSLLSREQLTLLGLKTVPARQRAAVLASMRGYLRPPRPHASVVALPAWLAWKGLGHLEQMVADELGVTAAPDFAWLAEGDFDELQLEQGDMDKMMELVEALKLLHPGQ